MNNLVVEKSNNKTALHAFLMLEQKAASVVAKLDALIDRSGEEAHLLYKILGNITFVAVSMDNIIKLDMSGQEDAAQQIESAYELIFKLNAASI